jgi:hypothetical protein
LEISNYLDRIALQMSHRIRCCDRAIIPLTSANDDRLYVARDLEAIGFRWGRSALGRDAALHKACQLKTETLDKSRFPSSLDPPRIPLLKGDLKRFPVPPLLKGG